MAKPVLGQGEIEGVQSPDRDDELHALGLELYDLQSRRMELTKATERERLIALAEEIAREADRKRVGLRRQSTASQDLRVTAESLREFISRAREAAQ